MKICYKSEIKDVDDKGRVVVAVNAFGNVDSDNDMSMPGSYTKTINESFARLKWFYNHDRTLLLGVPLEAKEVLPYLQVTGQLNMKKQLSRDVYEDYKLYAEHGRTLEHSVGVTPIKHETDENTGIRRVYEWKWWEFSTLSSWGANENTPLLDIKELKTKQDIVDHIGLLEKALKMNYTDSRLEKIENVLKSLQSLVNEPPDGTRKPEPIDIVNLLSNYNLFK